MMQYIQDLSLTSFFDLSAFFHASLFEGCAFPWEAIEKLSDYLASQNLGEIKTAIPSSAFLVNPSEISIGEGTEIEPGAYIQGPCIIGAHCKIRSGAYIRGGAIIGNHCVIGHGTEIKHSILLDHACAAHFNYVGDSILGNRVNLGAGVKCANYRFDHHPITVAMQEKKWETGLRKLGAIIGDDAQVGCNCVINPGTLLGKMSFCFPGLNIHGRVPDHAKVKPAQNNIVECNR
jgi:UDP-N-acetylglucosamine diphosphorylase / glucose-1-phosphate thymidylyltransferase / UDP-N-acetylgalactosamine diphosphorylase / glucosamine-1-phosphate N-acetyltransferase / galactosamine-1-phosphate N-acetyltransferase